MSGHLGFNEQRDYERGKPLTDDQKKHLKSCVSCRFYIKQESRWQKFVKWVKSFFSKKKTP